MPTYVVATVEDIQYKVRYLVEAGSAQEAADLVASCDEDAMTLLDQEPVPGGELIVAIVSVGIRNNDNSKTTRQPFTDPLQRTRI